MIFGEGPIIKNIAGDLNKLFLQGSRVGQSITNVEGDVAADQGTADLLAAMDPVIQEVAVGMSGEQAARYSISGIPPLSLPNSLGKPLKAWSVNLATYQEGSGAPSPTNVRPTHGTDKLTITTVGKNLLKNEKYQYTTTQVRLGATIAVEWYQMLPAGTYTVSWKYNGSGTVTAYYRYNDQYNYTIGTNGSSFTLSEPSNIGIYVYKSGSLDVNDFEWWQLEAGSTATNYAPYVAPTSTIITLPQTVYRGTVSADGGESNTARKILNGASEEEWIYSSGWSTTDTAVFYSNVQLDNALYGNWDVIYITNCNLFTPTTRNNLRFNDSQAISYSGNINDLPLISVRVSRSIASTVEEFTTYLASNPLEVVYQLITPIQFSLTAPDIPTPRGDATTWIVAEDGIVVSMEVTYIGKA